MDPSPRPIPTRLADLADPPPDRPAPAFDVFLAASALDDASAPAFRQRADRFSPAPAAIHPLAESAEALRLDRRRAPSDKVLAARASQRTFRDGPLPERRLEALLGALRSSNPSAGRRTWPSAGGLAAVQVHVVCRHVAGRFAAAVHRYQFDDHALSPVGPVPTDAELTRMFSIADDLPPLFVVFGVLVTDTLAKYGERGGRFALIEVGAAAQTLSLRLADVDLCGYLLGGLLDHDVAGLVGAGDTAYQPMLALAAGA